ncbi:LysM peptidoglycan-binding domain-containing protein [Rossellomorea sp. BNER]|uniref:LysM peptidoglycan-binding domain-containing protein n=1 Tax=Rossellomorea sp. BNER TaxID=2962031 RepID=UPI003AF26ABD|nr:LysM peptidoglycan-binding domain-containing protein [Rossellomorea sp. BNER]
MKRDPYRDQAEKLRQRIERVPSEEPKVEKQSLPPRGELHREKRQKPKYKVKYPLIRLLLVFFILLPLTFFTIYTYINKSGLPLIEKKSKNEEVILQKREDSSGANNDDAIPDDKEETEAKSSILTSEAKQDDSSEVKKVSHSNETKSTTVQTVSKKEPEPKPDPDPKPKQEPQPEPKKETESSAAQEEADDTIVYHTVKSNETLFSIAMRYYHSQNGINIIKQSNGINGNEIQSGQVLKIPL